MARSAPERKSAAFAQTRPGTAFAAPPGMWTLCRVVAVILLMVSPTVAMAGEPQHDGLPAPAAWEALEKGDA